MKEMSLDEFAQDVPASVEAVQRERIVITRQGKPVAVLVGIEFKDAEDWQLELSPEFWRMIEERRQETPAVSLEEFRSQLEADETARVRDLFDLEELEEAKRVLELERDQGIPVEEVLKDLRSQGSE